LSLERGDEDGDDGRRYRAGLTHAGLPGMGSARPAP
jgi:hypothetical protein